MYDAYNGEIDSDLKLSSFSSNLSATSDVDVEEFNRMNELAEQLVQLERHFEKTDTYHDFRRRVFDVLAAREARMRQGKTEVKGAMLIGPAGSRPTKTDHHFDIDLGLDDLQQLDSLGALVRSAFDQW